jgi:serine/threonine-protein kinase
VLRELGRGGTATVYLARDYRHGRLVALKVLEPALGAAMSAERFLREIRVTAGLTHPHILPLHDSGTAAGLLYYVMPYIEGETLRDRLAGGQALSLDAARRLLREVASALAYAHRCGVVHRDIKPANILFEDGHAIVADFGIARAMRRAQEREEAPGGQMSHSALHPPNRDGTETLTQGGISPGTPAYMAPEQARANVAVDHRADIYALGVVAYEGLAGKHPFGARTPQAMAAAHQHELPVPLAIRRPDVPPALAAIVMQALEKDQFARPQSADAIIAMLDTESDTEHANTSGMTRLVARRPVLMISAAAALTIALFVALGGLGVISWKPRGNASRSRAESVHGALATPVVGVDMGQRGTSDPEAYELYLKGHYYWTRRGATNLARSITYFRQAIARDSLFARAYAGLAMAYSALPDYVPDPTDSNAVVRMTSQQATELTRMSAERSVALDSTLADAQLALAIALDMRLQFHDALARYRVAAHLEPSSVTAHHWLGLSLLNLGHTNEALVELRHASELDPLAPTPAAALATALLFDRRFTEAEAAARRTLALDSTFAFAIYTLGVAEAFDGQSTSAVRTLTRGVRLHPDDARMAAALVFAYAAGGQWAAADRWRDKLHRLSSPNSGWAEAEIADLVIGDRKPLLHALTSRAGQLRLAQTGGMLGCNPFLDPLWSDAGFRAAMRRLGVLTCPLSRAWPLPARPRGRTRQI